MLCFVLINSILFNLLHVWRMKLFEIIIIINKVFIKCKLLSTEIIPSAYACTHKWVFLYKKKSISRSLAGDAGHLIWVMRSSHKSSATHSYQCVLYFHVSKQWYGCQCLGFLTRTQMLMPVIAHRGCMSTIRESPLETDSGEKVPCCIKDLNPHQYCA